MCDPDTAWGAGKDGKLDAITTSEQLRKALALSGRIADPQDLEEILQRHGPRGINKEHFLALFPTIPVLTKPTFTSAVKDLVVLADSGSSISIAELREILSTGQNRLTAAEINDILALQPHQETFNLEDFWEEYEDTLQRCAMVRTSEVSRLTASSYTSQKMQEAGAAFKKLSRKVKFHAFTRGCLLYENSNHISGHQFELELAADTVLTVFIQPVSLPVMTADIDPADNDLDLDVFLLRDADDVAQHRRLTAFTNVVDRQRRFSFQQRLTKGRYTLVPFTSGAWFNRPNIVTEKGRTRSSKRLIRQDKSTLELSAEYNNALEAVFEMADLDGDGRLNRREFEIFANRTTGDVVQDDDWKVVTASFQAENGQLSRDGFLQLHKMEASDESENNVHDLWITLAMGFNTELFLDKAVVYQLFIGSSHCQPIVTPTDIRSVTTVAEKCIIRAAMERGHPEVLEADIVLHKISNGSRFSLVLENTGFQEQIVECELKEAENCIASKEFPVLVHLSSKKAAVMAHFVPRDSKLPWKINTTELVK
ncbi:putative EF-hand calcium-binding domain-containing protein 7 [Hypsibius exemplaris]|uniref:EF-hand calcium-binding domain-containing protein 7 n=1 Tax=Hypsibius exemplaris TaxID=2072580 RepID=A0A1W0WRN3_HYPEX|nr:putative EF-hand calcium-binding domain-containing protein 7 [Hypsibius exemplaris]